MDSGIESAWATRRKRMTIGILIAIGISALAILLITIFYRLPTCNDNKQNQDETGIDCGGMCPRACALDVRPAVVEFVRPLNQSGRIDAIIYIRNPNQNVYAEAAPVKIEMYGSDGLLASTRVSVYLPPAATVPVFVPGVVDGRQDVRQAFATVENPSWFRATAPQHASPRVAEVETRDQTTRPRIVARIENTTAVDQFRIPVVVTVFDVSGTAIAASRTIVERLPAQGSATALFTWPAPWPTPGVRVEVMPIPTPPSAAALLGV